MTGRSRALRALVGAFWGTRVASGACPVLAASASVGAAAGSANKSIENNSKISFFKFSQFLIKILSFYEKKICLNR